MVSTSSKLSIENISLADVENEYMDMYPNLQKRVKVILNSMHTLLAEVFLVPYDERATVSA